ncbi:uridine kinase [Nakamurella sp. GG22]
MRFIPLTPERLQADLADWISGLPQDHPRIGIDGATETGSGELADAVAERVRASGRPVIRVTTDWWWRPASLRLELGRTDVDMLLGGWLDTDALQRELLDPLSPGGSGTVLRRFRDPATDRSVRDRPGPAGERAVAIIDGPFLDAARLPLEATVHLQVSPGALARALPADRQWWLDAFARYRKEYHPELSASAVVSYDHPSAPAVAWLADR